MKKVLFFLSCFLLVSGAILGQCVPTCSNYVVSPITYTSFTGTGTNAVPSLSPTIDDGYVTVPLGFTFNYYCTTYTSVIICSNGFIQFDLALPPVQNLADPTQNIPSSLSPNGIIALNMNDLDATSSGSLTYMTLGSAPNRMFVVSWDQVPIYAYPASLNTGQIVLYETSNLIDIYTGTVTNNSTTFGTQGIEDVSGTHGLAVTGRNDVLWSAANSGYRFSLADGPAPMTSNINGVTSLCAGTSATYSIASLPGATSYNWYMPPGWTGTSSATSISSMAGFSGTIQVSATYTCGTSDAATLAVTSLSAPVVGITTNSPIVCSGEVVGFVPSGADSYTLQPIGLVSNSGFTDMPATNTTYTLYGTDVNNCTSYNNPMVMITVNQSPTVAVNNGSICLGQQFTITATGADSYVYSTGFPVITPPSDGIFTYSVVGSNNNGCTAAPAISILTVVANPSVSISANRTSICNGESVVLTANGADSYVWVNGPSTNTYMTSPLLMTSYTVTGTSPEGCVKNAFITILVSPCTGIAEQQQAPAILVYPNPSDGTFMISTTESTSVEVYDLQGRLVLKQNLNEGQHVLDLRAVSAGNYFLKAAGNAASRTVILVKE